MDKRSTCLLGIVVLSLLFSCKKDSPANHIPPPTTVTYQGKYLLFDADQTFNTGQSAYPSAYTSIYYSKLDGKDVTRITPADAGYYCYRASWAPNGTYIIYIRGDAADSDRRLCTIDINGGHFSTITKGDEVDYGVFSPDGLRVAYAKSLIHFIPYKYDIYVSNYDGTGERRITTFADFNGAVANLHWASDGKIYFQATSDRDKTGIYSVNPDGSNLKYVLYDVDFLGVSPDSKYILFDLGDGLYSCNTDGTNLKTLVTYNNSNPNYLVGASWSPDGSLIYLSNADYPANFGIYSINSNGTNSKQILSGYYEFPTVH